MIVPLAQRVSDSEESAVVCFFWIIECIDIIIEEGGGRCVSHCRRELTRRKSSLDEKKLLKYINDESAIFKPEGLVGLVLCVDVGHPGDRTGACNCNKWCVRRVHVMCRDERSGVDGWKPL